MNNVACLCILVTNRVSNGSYPWSKVSRAIEIAFIFIHKYSFILFDAHDSLAEFLFVEILCHFTDNKSNNRQEETFSIRS